MKDQREKQKETEEVEVETEEEEEEEKEEEEEEEEEKEEEAAKPSTAEKRGTKRKRRSTGRSPAWTWQESFTLLKLIEKHGKGKWEFMLEQLQRLHLCNKVRDGKAVAKHYSTLKGKKSTLYNSNWQPPEFDRQSLLGKSAPKQRRLEEAYATTVQQLTAEREEARQIITKLEKSESVLDSAKKKKVAEAKKDVEDAAKERAKERERRLKEAEMEAKQARESREIFTKLAKAQLELSYDIRTQLDPRDVSSYLSKHLPRAFERLRHHRALSFLSSSSSSSLFLAEEEEEEAQQRPRREMNGIERKGKRQLGRRCTLGSRREREREHEQEGEEEEGMKEQEEKAFLRQQCEEVHQDLRPQCMIGSGSTAVIAFIERPSCSSSFAFAAGKKEVAAARNREDNATLTVVNCGDSRALLCRCSKAVQLSVDSCPDTNFGSDAFDKRFVHVCKEYIRPDEDEFLVLLSDGVYNAFPEGNQAVISFIHEKLKTEEATTVAQLLVEEARCREEESAMGGREPKIDDMTALIIPLTSYIHPSSKDLSATTVLSSEPSSFLSSSSSSSSASFARSSSGGSNRFTSFKREIVSNRHHPLSLALSWARSSLATLWPFWFMTSLSSSASSISPNGPSAASPWMLLFPVFVVIAALQRRFCSFPPPPPPSYHPTFVSSSSYLSPASSLPSSSSSSPRSL